MTILFIADQASEVLIDASQVRNRLIENALPYGRGSGVVSNMRIAFLSLVLACGPSRAQGGASPLDGLDSSRIADKLRLAGQPSEVVAILPGHRRGVASLAFSPDGRTLASSGWDNKIRWWRVEGKEMKEHAVADGSPSGVAFSPDGRLLVAGGADSKLHVWENDKKARSLPGHRNRPFAIAISSDGKLLATGCGNPTLRVWKLDDDEPEAWAVLANETTQALGVSSLSFSHDGKYLAMGHHTGKCTLRIWDVGGKFMEELDIPDAMARLVAFSPKEPLLAFSGDDSIRLWEFKGGKAIAKMRLTGRPRTGRPGAVKAIAFAADGKSLVSTGQDHRVILWDVPTGKIRQEWTFPEESRAVAFGPEGRHLAVGCEDGSIYFLRLSPAKMRN